MKKKLILEVIVIALFSISMITCSNDEVIIQPNSLRLITDTSDVLKRVSSILVDEIKKRTNAAITENSEAKYSLILKIDKKNVHEVDGFKIVTTPDSEGRIYVIGQSESGLVAGVGKLLRISQYIDGKILMPDTTIMDFPKMPLRGVYIATHYHNFYDAAPLEQIDKVIEEMSLWGANSLITCFDMHHFNGFNDPAAQEHLSNLIDFSNIAHGIGMEFGITFLANEGYANGPKKLLAKQSKGIADDYGTEICPSIKEGMELIRKNHSEIINAFPKLDMICSWPYDQGGCACENCSPWGGNGFIRSSEELANDFHKRFPNGKVWVSTWNFDLRHLGDYDGFFNYMEKEKPDWIYGLLTGIQSPTYARTFERPDSARYPLAWFPEVSMLKVRPWASWGANPVPDRFKGIMNELKEDIVGGWIYSEGIYEDLNKFLWISYFWNPDRDLDDIMHEYAAYYFCPKVADDAVKFFHLLEKTFPRKDWDVKNLKEADEAYAIAKKIDKSIPEWTKKSWRWRIFYIRANIDNILKNEGHTSEKAKTKLKSLFKELEEIYFIQSDTYKWLIPLKLN